MMDAKAIMVSLSYKFTSSIRKNEKSLTNELNLASLVKRIFLEENIYFLLKFNTNGNTWLIMFKIEKLVDPVIITPDWLAYGVFQYVVIFHLLFFFFQVHLVKLIFN